MRDGEEIGSFEKRENTFFYKVATFYYGVVYEDGKLYYYMMEFLLKFKLINKRYGTFSFDFCCWANSGKIKFRCFAFDLENGENLSIDVDTYLRKWEANAAK